jgi:hypothetical protein
MSRRVEPLEFTVYSGREPLGFVRPVAGQYEAVMASGEPLGHWNTSQAAANAVCLRAHRDRGLPPGR